MVTTRKEHPCFGCTEAINKGVSAVYVTANEDEQHTRFHLHEDCSKTIVKDKRFSGSGLYYGFIKEAEKTCCSCGHYLIGGGCWKEGNENLKQVQVDDNCGSWVPENTEGTITCQLKATTC
ncbi:hypothetical protein ACMGD3_08765 [Lysinibacillus sphaericus]|uniref:hypothetical protein n=1 Tax=Lysinibacillus sphaericus TaxID=1421 RepID=UPI001C5E4705